jgi:hypothetical protein
MRDGRTHMSPTRRSVLIGAFGATPLLLAPALTGQAGTITVASGETYVVTATTRTNQVIIATGGILTAPSGYSLTMTVNGVETGQALTATGAAGTAFLPGTYTGDIVLTVAKANDITWAGVSATLIFPFRQALYVDAAGISNAYSVLAAATGGRTSTNTAQNIAVASTGEVFDGVYVTDGDFTLKNSRIQLEGNGRCDFDGYGAAIVGTGSATRLVVDGVDVRNRGAVRTAVIANNTANVIVKNSRLHTGNGVLPSDYVPTVDTTYMESAPWMLGIAGNVRATNVLGTSTQATYINSAVSSEGWGVLSSDNGSDCKLTAINCDIAITGDAGGYGSYAIGNATERFLGCSYDVGTYACINRGGAVSYGDSTPKAVAALNEELSLGLTQAELNALQPRPTRIRSRRFGFMWHGAGSLAIGGGTTVDTEETTFLDKGQQVTVTVDGSEGARLNPGNGILFQLMENDDPGPVMVNGKVVNQGVYTEPTTTATKDSTFDVSTAHTTDAVATFTAIGLRGDFYNGMRGDLNLALTFDNSHVEGVISATTTKHHVSSIDSTQFLQLGEVTNTTGAVVNNGVIVDLAGGSSWTVTGTSYLSKLTIDATSSVVARPGSTVTLTVDGTAKTITPGTTYTGAITLTLA